MRYIKILLLSAAIASISPLCSAAEQSDSIPEWHLSSTEEFSLYRSDATDWVSCLDNQVGSFAYDANSLNYGKDGEKDNTQLVEVTVRTIFAKSPALKRLQEKYKPQLNTKEKVTYWLMKMQFDINRKCYTVLETEYYTNKNKKIDSVTGTGEMKPVPAESFASAMFNICKEWSTKK